MRANSDWEASKLKSALAIAFCRVFLANTTTQTQQGSSALLVALASELFSPSIHFSRSWDLESPSCKTKFLFCFSVQLKCRENKCKSLVCVSVLQIAKKQSQNGGHWKPWQRVFSPWRLISTSCQWYEGKKIKELNCKKRSRRVFLKKKINVSKKGFLEKHFTFTFELYKRWFFPAGQFYVQLVF